VRQNSKAVLRQLHPRDPRTSAIRLSRSTVISQSPVCARLRKQLESARSQRRPTSSQAARKDSRILLISDEHLSIAGIRVASWTSSIPNAADYEAVVLDLVSLGEAVRIGKVDLSKPLKPTAKQIHQLVWSQGVVICIMPRFLGDRLEAADPIIAKVKGLLRCSSRLSL